MVANTEKVAASGTCPPTAPTLPLKLRGFGTPRRQLKIECYTEFPAHPKACCDGGLWPIASLLRRKNSVNVKRSMPRNQLPC